MDELQLLETQTQTWDDWDEISLSTLDLRLERLEILLCQKTKNGEDISQCLQALQYLKERAEDQQRRNSYLTRKPSFCENLERFGLNSALLAFLLSGCFAICAAGLGAFYDSNPNTQTHKIDLIYKTLKRLEKFQQPQ